jgi:cyclopropane-fatty-acyl-phospholipid synthase
MTYSSGVEVGDDLERAQLRKYARLARSIDLAPEHHVLEIGCGWGGFAEWAAREVGCRVTAATISREQFDFARERIRSRGIEGLVDVQLRDYRDLAGEYDRVVSIEMFEAVGERYWPTFFDAMRRLLRPGGMAALQVITIREDLFARYRSEMDFIRAHVFPGGMLPTRERLRELGAGAGLRSLADDGFGLDYARTCAIWLARFEQAWPRVAALGFDERFHRLWTYYLAYCEAGFQAGTVDVRQVAWRREG